MVADTSPVGKGLYCEQSNGEMVELAGHVT